MRVARSLRSVSSRAAVPLAALAVLLAAPPAALAAARPRTVVVAPPCPGPLCPGAAPVPAALGKRVVWLVFDGVALTRSDVEDDAAVNRSAIVTSSMTIPKFQVADLGNSGGLGRQAIIDRTIEELESIFAPYDVHFVTERPAARPYSSIVFGGTCGGVAGQSCAGIALLDCGDSLPGNITFVFPRDLDYRDLAPTAAQESAHALGLAHTLDEDDVMFPSLQNGFPDHFGDTDASCPFEEVQQGLTCDRTSQNSHELMLWIVGPRGQDVAGPEVVFTSHAPGDTIRAGEAIATEISDPAGVATATLLVNGSAVGEARTAPPYDFAFPEGVAAGEVAVGVRATDDKGNTSTTALLLVTPGADATGCAGVDDPSCGDGFRCDGDVCVPDDGRLGLGEICDGSADCGSAACGELDGEKRCTRPCGEAVAGGACPDGFSCRGDSADAAGACWPAEGAGGCGCHAGGAGGVPGLLVLLGLALLGARRRR